MTLIYCLVILRKQKPIYIADISQIKNLKSNIYF